jgi:hypothetical protein
LRAVEARLVHVAGEAPLLAGAGCVPAGQRLRPFCGIVLLSLIVAFREEPRLMIVHPARAELSGGPAPAAG